MKNTFKIPFIASIIFISACNKPDAKYIGCVERQKKEEANKKMVTEFYQELFGNKNIDVIDKYIAKDYIQHNPSVTDGRDALKEALKGWFANAQKDTVDFQRVVAEDDLVILHIKGNMGSRSVAIVDIFRIENDSIAEHWDVIQQVPDSTVNPHPMF